MDSSILINFVCELGLSAIKDKLATAADQKMLRDRLEAFIEEQRKENFNCTIDEEIDFGGLAEYLRTELLEDVKLKLFGTNKERQIAYNQIMVKTAQFAQGKTQLSCNRAQKIVSQALNILTKFFRLRINRELRFLAGEIEDLIEENQQKIQEEILQLGKNISESMLLSTDNNLRLAKSGRLDLVQDNLATVMDALSSTHCLKPYYGFRFDNDNKLRSVPLMPESVELFPPRFDISATKMKLGNTPITKIDCETYQMAYNHQMPISFDVVMAKKYLGMVEDPAQTEATEMIGAHVIVNPPEFPHAFPCNVYVGADVMVDYLLLRTVEILDDGTAIITNDEQSDFNFDVQIEFNPRMNKLTFNVTPHNPTNRQFLHYKEFLQRVNNGENVTLKVLSVNQPLVSGIVEHTESERNNAVIKFLRQIIVIEDYFKSQIIIPEEIKNKDYFMVNHLANLIKGSCKENWDKFDFIFNLTEETKNIIKELKDQVYVLFYADEVNFEIFGQQFTLSLLRIIPNARIFNLKKTKKKSEILDVGDDLRVQFIPGTEKGEYIDQINTGDIEKGVVFFQ